MFTATGQASNTRRLLNGDEIKSTWNPEKEILDYGRVKRDGNSGAQVLRFRGTR